HLLALASFPTRRSSDLFVGSFGVGTNLVLNNQRRIQVVGVGGFNLWRRVTLWYYNDGGPFFKYFGDRYDRWWTGGGGLEIYLGRSEEHTSELQSRENIV